MLQEFSLWVQFFFFFQKVKISLVKSKSCFTIGGLENYSSSIEQRLENYSHKLGQEHSRGRALEM